MSPAAVDPTETPHALDARTWRGRVRQWAPIVAPPLLWTFSELASYWIVEISCGAGWLQGARPHWLAPRIFIGAIGLASLLIIVLLERGPWRQWDRRLDEQAHGQPYAYRHQFMALAALVSAAAFGTAVLYHTITFVLTPVCATVLR